MQTWQKLKSIPSTVELDRLIFKYLKKGMRILDTGCGQGRISLELATMGYDVTGVDINHKGIEEAIKRASGLSNARFLCLDAEALTFKEGAFDFVIMNAFLTAVIPHKKRFKVLKEAQRVLTTNGYLYVADFLQNWHNPLYRQRYMKGTTMVIDTEGTFEVYDEEGNFLYLAHHFSEKEIVSLIDECGFTLRDFIIRKFTTRSGNSVYGFVIIAVKV